MVNEQTPSQKSKEPLRWRSRVRAVLGLALLLGMPVAGQSPFQQQFPAGNTPRLGQHPPDSDSPFGGRQDSSSLDEKRVRLLNAARQKSMVSDADKLLKLAKELNDEVAGGDSATMTDAQLRKVAEIAKLAKNVKEKMSFSVGGFPSVSPSPTVTLGPDVP